jgi:hypothetical protein
LRHTRDIEKDEIITLYPGDAQICWDEKYGGKPAPRACELQAQFGALVDKES